MPEVEYFQEDGDVPYRPTDLRSPAMSRSVVGFTLPSFGSGWCWKGEGLRVQIILRWRKRDMMVTVHGVKKVRSGGRNGIS